MPAQGALLLRISETDETGIKAMKSWSAQAADDQDQDKLDQASAPAADQDAISSEVVVQVGPLRSALAGSHSLAERLLHCAGSSTTFDNVLQASTAQAHSSAACTLKLYVAFRVQSRHLLCVLLPRLSVHARLIVDLEQT